MKKLITLLVCGLVLFLSSCSTDDVEPVPVDWALDLAVYEQDMMAGFSNKYYVGLTIISEQPMDNAQFQFYLELNYLYEDQPIQGVFNQNSFKLVERGRKAGERYSYFIISKEPIINFTDWVHPDHEIKFIKKELISGYVFIQGRKHLFNKKEYIYNP